MQYKLVYSSIFSIHTLLESILRADDEVNSFKH